MNAAEIGASLLHAAYDQGMFPSGRPGAIKANRDHVRRRVGETIETYVFAYHSERLPDSTIDALLALPDIEPARRRTVTMRLADIADDLQDCGAAATPGKFDEGDRRRLKKAIALAEHIKQPDLAALLRAGEAENEAGAWARAAVGGVAPSFTIYPPFRKVLRLAVGSAERRIPPFAFVTRLARRIAPRP
jgi:hypothetical protein